MPTRFPSTLPSDEEYAIAAPSVAIGDPTGTMLDLGQIMSADIALNPTKATASDVGGHQKASGAFDRGIQPEVTLTINDVQAAVIATLMTAAEYDSANAGNLFYNDVTKLDPPTLCVIPNGKESGAISNGGVWWFPAVIDTDVGSITEEDAEGEDANNPVDYTLSALRRTTDQASTSIQKGAQMAFTVPPGQLSPALSWTLPSAYT